MNSDANVDFSVYDSYGSAVLYVDDVFAGSEIGTFVIEYPEPYFLVVSQLTENPVTFTVEATHSLTPIPDPDDSQRIAVGGSVIGNIDYPGDIDIYTVRLPSNQNFEFSSSSFLIDTYLVADYHGAFEEQIIIDDDSGGGLFGLDSKIIYRAPHTGDYLIAVSDLDNYVGAYVLKIGNASPSAQLTSTTWADLFEE